MLVVLAVSAVYCNSQIFPFSAFENHPELCKDLSEKLYEDFKSSGQNLKTLYERDWSEFRSMKLTEKPKKPVTENFFFNSTHIISKRGEPHYTFRFLIGVRDRQPRWNLTVQFDSTANISSIVPKGTLEDLLPMDTYITKYVFPEDLVHVQFGESIGSVYHLIEGTRCKLLFNNETVPNGKVVCWDSPSLCRGHYTMKRCIANDDIDYLCLDSISQEGTPFWGHTSDLERHWTKLAGTIYWAKPAIHFIYKNQTIESHKPELTEWMCSESDEEGVDYFCESNKRIDWHYHKEDPYETDY